MNRKQLISRLFKYVVGVFILLALAFGAWKTYDLVSKRLPVPDTQLTLAQNGISQNKDWTPVIRQFDGLDWALVPTGCFQMGSTEQQVEQALSACRAYGGEKCPYVFDQPNSQVCFDEPYWVTVTEITNRQYGSGFNANLDLLYPMRRESNWPRDSVTWQEATDYCASINTRLPTEAEWEYAARGPDALIYPWGNEMSSGYQEEAWRLSPQKAGSVTSDVSWVGAHGLAGNVAEWVEGIFEPSTTQNETRIVRGGSWASYADFLLRTTQRLPYNPKHASSLVGFRCLREFDETR